MAQQDSNLVMVEIDRLVPGMFVSAIEQGKRIDLASPGRVSSDKAIQKLRASKVQFVWVDASRSAKGVKVVEYVPPVKPAPVEEASKTPKKKVSREISQKRAKSLIIEAKGLVNKLLIQTKANQEMDIGLVADLSDEMIDSVLYAPDAIKCMAALRQKDSYLLEHSINVALLLVTFGRSLGFEREELKALSIGGLIHDIGKTQIRDDVLLKPGKLTPEEFEHIKLHQVYAQQQLKTMDNLDEISRNVCLMHHEKLDGSGYPLGLTADQMPIYGRMSSIVDIYDALTADRVYKQGMSSSEAFKILLKLTPNHLDADLVYKFINCIGIYPVGSLVELSDGRVGIVWTGNDNQPLKPEIKCIYSNKYKRFIDVSLINLKNSSVTISKAISPNTLNFDVAPFYD
ncbi:HD-GYP domain-containing protein [Vibrio ulleungensis]|uniref:HD-GYP domain-containing protein n=1 Tax=Vibrio ulleungensis TaxID=2807619 RepID=A0ABS2HBU1_9VIBR|nr:HD-GYP domain-containing protein [Vibrio ulleungensis]MBM7035068.1 HD-GYP domain-containing protein [Vibrio ulleungensis]